MKKIMLTVAAVAVLAGCGGLGTNMNPGAVASREIEPGEFETKKSKTCVQYKNGTCKRYITTSRQVWDDEDFEIVLTDGREFELSGRAVFDRCMVGRTFYPKSGRC